MSGVRFFNLGHLFRGSLGDDLAALKSELHDRLRAVPASSTHDLEQSGLTSWSIGELPRVVEVGDPPVPAYPALVDEGGSVAVRLLATADEQADAMWAGTRRLLALNLPSIGRHLRLLLTDEQKRAVRTGPHGAPAEWVADCATCIAGQILVDGGGPVWDGTGFDGLLDVARRTLPEQIETVGAASLRILALARELRATLRGVEGAAGEDMRGQLDQLVYPGFLTGVGADRLGDVERYLRAMVRRLDRLAEDPAGDAELMARVSALESEHDRMVEVLGPTPELADIAWMLQELRVSLFAQALGTRGKVSEQRITRALTAL